MKFFGEKRQTGRVNKNPMVHQFLNNSQALRVVGNNSDNISSEVHVSSEPLPKRRITNG